MHATVPMCLVLEINLGHCVCLFSKGGVQTGFLEAVLDELHTFLQAQQSQCFADVQTKAVPSSTVFTCVCSLVI